MPRDYKSEYHNYLSKPAQIANRAKRTAAGAAMDKMGVVNKNDGLDVDHKTPIAKGGGNGASNLRAVPASQNRSFARTKNAGMK